MELILTSEFDVAFPRVKDFFRNDQRRAVFIPTAADGEGYQPDYQKNQKLLEDCGIHVDTFDIANQTEGAVGAVLSLADIIYVGGGNTFYLLEHMNKCSFKKLLLDRLTHGGLYIGSSAGSIVCSPDIGFISSMDDPLKGCLKSNNGLDLISFSFLPHLNHVFHGAMAKNIVATYNDIPPLLALNDEQFLHVRNKSVSVYDCRVDVKSSF